MKANLLLTIGLCVGLGSGVLPGRTWTSSDGSKTFEGDFKSYDKDADKVTVIMKNGHPMKFDLKILSEEDRTWTKDTQQKADADAAIKSQKIGAKLVESDTLKAVGEEGFEPYEMTKSPEYYLLYFSASW